MPPLLFSSDGPAVWFYKLPSTICKYWSQCNICQNKEESNIYGIHKPQFKTNASNGVSILNWLPSKQTGACIHLFLQSTIDYGSVIIKQDSEVQNQYRTTTHAKLIHSLTVIQPSTVYRIAHCQWKNGLEECRICRASEGHQVQYLNGESSSVKFTSGARLGVRSIILYRTVYQLVFGASVKISILSQSEIVLRCRESYSVFSPLRLGE